MYSKVDKPKINNSRMNAKQGKGVIRENRPANTFLDNRPSSISLSNLTNVMQKKGGSHNKKQMIKIKSYIIRDNATNAVITHRVNENIDLGFIKGHPSGFTDWDDYAHQKVQKDYVNTGETLISVDYKTFSKS